MYPRNAASPPIIDLGQILQLSDGAVQTSGASVRVKIGTGSWGAGAGSLDCDATSGIWTYAPTQAETNDAFFVVAAYKSGCSALSKTVITSASATAGYAGLDWSKITAPTTTVGLSGTTIKTATDIETDTVDIQSRIPDALENGRMKASVSGTGSGARTVTITVTLNGTPVEGALIRLTKAAESYLGTTDEDGEEVFNVNDGTWTVAITAANASFDGDELVVNGDETPIYPMTATSFTASSASLVTGYWTCYSHLGVVESGVTITMICKKVPAESGFALDSATRTATSGADGIAQFANLIPGATYQVARGSGQNFMIKVPDDATGTIELNSILGS